ncbi:hypothetical protein [uncultured Modestobacter sp.]|uniref:hypothetical protein n=1 Tax=uncultured Modestobacter sp. TaxID=380048 RepID=UPI0026053AA0|nr:hypothetical protein [uncultured Modestobacter sp.]
MTAPSSDIHDGIFDEIKARISTLQAGAPTAAPDGGARSQADVDGELAQLEADKTVLLAHWRTQDGVVATTAPVYARACGQPQPCPHVLGLAEKFGLA